MTNDIELIKLTPHLIEKIQAILVADLNLPELLRFQLQKACNSYSTNSTVSDTFELSSEQASESGPNDDGPSQDLNGIQLEIPSEDSTPTIPVNTIEDLSKWTSGPGRARYLKSKRLSSSDYNLISLLAGTEVYIPAAQLSRLKELEESQKDKPNPFLPSHLSPKPPSIGKEYRTLTRQLSTILNILFSIFGSAAAVYVASTTGGGFRKETAVILAVLTGLVVGIADGVLVWIWSGRSKIAREESRALGYKMAKGSGGLGLKEDASRDVLELEGSTSIPKDDDTALDATLVVEENGTTALSDQVEPVKREFRLRRRDIGKREED